jgi:hypothetical protein
MSKTTQSYTFEDFEKLVPEKGLIICATPRSGSTLLLEDIRSTGYFGKPEEHLWIFQDNSHDP